MIYGRLGVKSLLNRFPKWFHIFFIDLLDMTSFQKYWNKTIFQGISIGIENFFSMQNCPQINSVSPGQLSENFLKSSLYLSAFNSGVPSLVFRLHKFAENNLIHSSPAAVRLYAIVKCRTIQWVYVYLGFAFFLPTSVTWQ